MVINIERDANSLKWSMYKSVKPFLTFLGVFSVQGAPWTLSDPAVAEERCLELGWACVAMERRGDSSVVTLMDYIDLDTFTPSPTANTSVMALTASRESKILARSAWDFSDLDNCCPGNKEIDQENVRQSVRDNIRRISCDIPAEEFEADYVRRQVPVILEGCTTHWPAQNSWTFDSLLELGGGKETWRTDYITNQHIMNLWGQKGEILYHIDVLAHFHSLTCRDAPRGNCRQNQAGQRHRQSLRGAGQKKSSGESHEGRGDGRSEREAYGGLREAGSNTTR